MASEHPRHGFNKPSVLGSEAEEKTPERQNRSRSSSDSHLEVGIDGTGPVPVLLQSTAGAQVVSLRATGTGQGLSSLSAVSWAADVTYVCAANKQRRSRHGRKRRGSLILGPNNLGLLLN